MATPSLEKAAAVAKLSKKHGGLFVFATRSTKLLASENASAEIAKHKFAEHACNDCGTHFEMAHVKSMQPFCVTCGSEHVKVLSASKTKIPADSELASATCSCCGTKAVIRPELAAVAGSIHCTVCGTSMKLKADAEGEGEDETVPSETVDADDLELVDVDDEPVEEETAEQTQGEPGTEMSPLNPDPVNPVTTTQQPGVVDGNEELPRDPDDKTTNTQQVQVANEVGGEDVGVGLDDVDVNMVDELDGNEDVELSFVHIDKNVHLIGKQQIVATLSEADAGDNAEMMHTEQFRKAVAHSIETLGLKKAVAQYGFKPAIVKIPLKKTFAKAVEASVAKHTKALSTAQREVFEDVSQCLDISAAGFAGNFWRGKVDPLKAALANELKSVGVKNSTVFIDRVFASHAVAHVQQVIELAKEIIKKPVEARNALAQAIDMAKYQPMVVKAADESQDEDLDDQVADEDGEDEVLSVARIVESEPVVASSTSNQSTPYRSPELARILGNSGLPFSQ